MSPDHQSDHFAGWVDLYDVFVDWEGRLAREMPGLTGRFRSAGAERVLDVGCGTGRHVEAMLAAGYDAHGADASQAMLDEARHRLGGDERLHHWALGEPAPASLGEAGPFDAITCLGNTWPQVTSNAGVEKAAGELRRLLRPAGALVVGLKALAVRRESGNPYMKLLKRRHDGRALFFVRFIDFDGPPGEDVCDFHMIIASGEGGGASGEPAPTQTHTVHRIRVWSVDQLRATFEAAGFEDVRISGAIGAPGVEPAGEDVFIHAIADGKIP